MWPLPRCVTVGRHENGCFCAAWMGGSVTGGWVDNAPPSPRSQLMMIMKWKIWRGGLDGVQLPAYLSLYFKNEFLLFSATCRIKVASKHGTPVLTSYDYTFPLYTTISCSAALHDPSLQQGTVIRWLRVEFTLGRTWSAPLPPVNNELPSSLLCLRHTTVEWASGACEMNPNLR